MEFTNNISTTNYFPSYLKAVSLIITQLYPQQNIEEVCYILQNGPVLYYESEEHISIIFINYQHFPLKCFHNNHELNLCACSDPLLRKTDPSSTIMVFQQFFILQLIKK